MLKKEGEEKENIKGTEANLKELEWLKLEQAKQQNKEQQCWIITPLPKNYKCI